MPSPYPLIFETLSVDERSAWNRAMDHKWEMQARKGWLIIEEGQRIRSLVEDKNEVQQQRTSCKGKGEECCLIRMYRAWDGESWTK